MRFIVPSFAVLLGLGSVAVASPPPSAPTPAQRSAQAPPSGYTCSHHRERCNLNDMNACGGYNGRCSRLLTEEGAPPLAGCCMSPGDRRRSPTSYDAPPTGRR